MKNKEATIFYSASEYDCCGPEFSVGDYIWWTFHVCKKNEVIGDKEIYIDYYCHNCSDGDLFLSGKIKKIEAIKNNKIIESQKSREISKFGVDYIIYLEKVEEYLCKDYNDINYNSNPFLDKKYKNKKNYYKIIKIIGDSNDIALDIAKIFKKKHLYLEIATNKNKIIKFTNEINKIKSYSREEYYYLNYLIKEYKNSSMMSGIKNSLIILIDKNNKYQNIYNELVKELNEGYYKFSICYIKENKSKYDINYVYPDKAKSKKELKKCINSSLYDEKYLFNNIKNINILYTMDINNYTKKQVLKFLNHNDNREISTKKNNLIIFVICIILWIIFKLLRFLKYII